MEAWQAVHGGCKVGQIQTLSKLVTEQFINIMSNLIITIDEFKFKHIQNTY